RHERDLPADQGVRRRLLCPGTPVARSRRPMGREDRQSLPLLAGTPRVRVRPRELTGEVAARCERGGPFCIYFLHLLSASTFCIYFLHCHELRTGNTPKRLATSVRPNPSLHPTRYSGLRPLPRAGELKRSAANGHHLMEERYHKSFNSSRTPNPVDLGECAGSGQQPSRPPVWLRDGSGVKHHPRDRYEYQ